MHCDICGSSENSFLFGKGRNNESVVNLICRRCGLIYVKKNEHSEKNLKKKYSNGSFSINARGSILPSKKKIKKSESRALKRFKLLSSIIDLQTIPSGRLLEIGCGVGSFLRLMRGAGWDVEGLEPDIVYAEKGQQIYNIKIEPEFYENKHQRENYFDMIASFHTIEHVISPRSFIQKASKELRNGGLIFLETPCIERPFQYDLEKFFWSAHLFTFSKNTLSGLLKQMGFKIIKYGYSGNSLWILAENDVNLFNDVCYPFDNYKKIIRHTLIGYKFFKSQGYIWKIKGYFSKAIDKLNNNPVDFIPALKRKANKKSKKILKIFKIYVIKHENYIAHFGLHTPGNAGDTLLFVAVRRIIDNTLGRQKWSLEPLRKEVSGKQIERINRYSKFIIIGGGGLILRDTNENKNSGWQWDCPIELVNKIKVPIVVFAIGYNRFRGQKDFDPIFKLHIQNLVKRSTFFGLRNKGSIKQLSKYIEGSLIDKLKYQPCPTTLLNYIYPGISSKYNNENKNIALNIAFDRSVLRFGNHEDEILTNIAKVMKWLNQKGWRIKIAIHCGIDSSIIPWLIKEEVNFEEVFLNGKTYKKIINFYKGVSIAIGMRGHSQMIPFGLSIPIISLISHDKIGYFLEDISHPEWGIEIQDPQLQNSKSRKNL